MVIRWFVCCWSGLRLPYCMDLYIKAEQSKIEMVCKIIKALPDFPTAVYVLADSWYSSESIIKATRSRGFEYIGAFKTNRVLYYPGGPKLGNKAKAYVRTLTEDNPDTYILNTYTCRWRIEVFFRDSKMQLDLDNYQVRSITSIKRFLLLTMLSYAYCISISENSSGSLSKSRRTS